MAPVGAGRQPSPSTDPAPERLPYAGNQTGNGVELPFPPHSPEWGIGRNPKSRYISPRMRLRISALYLSPMLVFSQMRSADQHRGAL